MAGRRVRIGAVKVCCVVGLLSLGVDALASAPGVVSVNPTGSVKNVQQVVVRFATDMVAMGDPRVQKAPVEVKCVSAKPEELPSATSRWVDSRTWSYDFANKLKSGTRCVVAVVAVSDGAGASLSARPEYAFTTGGPSVLRLLAGVYDDSGIDPGQYFALQVDSPVKLSSMLEHGYFESDKTPGKIKLRLIDGKDREAVLEYFGKRGELGPGSAERWKAQGAKGFSDIIVVAGTTRFPEGSRLVFHWPKGIESTKGDVVSDEQLFRFNVAVPFEVKFSCERGEASRPCNPIADMVLEFSAPIEDIQMGQVTLVGGSGKIWKPQELSRRKDDYHNRDGWFRRLTFKGPFPPATSLKVQIAPALRDKFGRELINKSRFPLLASTDEYLPLVKFSSPFGILEALVKEPALMPVSVRNVEAPVRGGVFSLPANSSPSEVINWYGRVQDKEEGWWERRNMPLLDGRAVPIEIPKPGGQRDFEVVGIPLKSKGAHIVELQSDRLGEALTESRGTMYVSSMALVTNLAVHFKQGRESSVVWVTSLDNSRPVAGASVTILNGRGETLANGKTDNLGLYRTGELDYPCAWRLDENRGRGEDERNTCEVFAFASTADDYSFVSNEWKKGTESFRYNVMYEYLAPKWGPVVAHAVLDRALIQAGETLHFKVFARDHTMNGFKALEADRLPKSIKIFHQGSRKVYSLPFNWDPATGSADVAFDISLGASLGLYEIYLSHQPLVAPKLSQLKDRQEEAPESIDWAAKSVGNFMVAEYRLPTMVSKLKFIEDNVVQPRSFSVDASAAYLAGGAAKKLRVKLRSSLGWGGGRAFPDFEGYSFFGFSGDKTKQAEESAQLKKELEYVSVQEVELGADGGRKVTFSDLPLISGPRTLSVEMEYRDPNGEARIEKTSKVIFSTDLAVGMKAEPWYLRPQTVVFSGATVDLDGKARPGIAYKVTGSQVETMTHRKKLVGGLYSYDSTQKTIELGTICEGKSDANGRFSCKLKPGIVGQVYLAAEIADTKGRKAYANTVLQIYKEGEDVWWAQDDNDRVDLIPARQKYEPGQNAKFVLRAPFEKSQVLVSVEREGVMDTYVKEISRDNPSFEIPIKKNYAPNVYISAVALRGRIGKPQPTSMVDLAKPSMKQGLAGIKVGWAAHELKVGVATDKKRYQVREKMTVNVKATSMDRDVKALGPAAEVALFVVDESAGLLRKNWTTDLLLAMMSPRGLAVGTSTSQSMVVGKRHFGSKAKPPGGGGGAQTDARELSDPVVFWQGRAKLNANGEAQVVVPLKDAISRFSVVAVVSNGLGQFGTGQTSIEATRDLIIYSGFAPVVHRGDSVDQEVTIRNTTNREMTVDVSIDKIGGGPAASAKAHSSSVQLKGSSATAIRVPLAVPEGDVTSTAADDYLVTAKERGGVAEDRLKVKTSVEATVPPRVLQATLFQIEKSGTKLDLKQPADAIPGSGGLRVDISSSLISGLSAVRSYMQDYPYGCLEQRWSRAIVLEDKAELKKLISAMPEYLDSMGLLMFFPRSHDNYCGSVGLTRYVVDTASVAGIDLPRDLLEKIGGGLQSAVQGQESCRSSDRMEKELSSERRILMMSTLARMKKFDPIYLESTIISPNNWKSETLAEWYSLLEKETKIPNRDVLYAQAATILKSRLNFQGTSMTLQGAPSQRGVEFSLFTSGDQEAIKVFGTALDRADWSVEAPRMARGLMARLRSGIWDSTMANTWGFIYFRRFAKKFEKQTVTGVSDVVVGTQNWSQSPEGKRLEGPWPKGSESKATPVVFNHKGNGKPWVSLSTISSIPLKAPLSMGFSVERKLVAVEQKRKDGWTRGDIVDVELKITVSNDQNWVVISDPIPAGATHLSGELDGLQSSYRMPRSKQTPAQTAPGFPLAFVERKQARYLGYAPFVGKGVYQISYRLRLNASGQLKLPPTRVEAMYNPEMFSESPNEVWSVARE